MKPIGLLILSLMFTGSAISQGFDAKITTKQGLSFDQIQVKNVATEALFSFSNVESVHFSKKSQRTTSDLSLETEIYPNPAADIVNLRFTNPAEGTVSVWAIHLSGQTLASFTAAMPAGTFNAVLTNLPSGLVIIKATIGNRTMGSKVMVHANNQGNPEISIVDIPGTANQKSLELAEVEYSHGDRFLITATQNYMKSNIAVSPQTDMVVNLEFPVCTDADGNQYETVQIGNQLWMAENLRSTTFSNGDRMIPVAQNSDWRSLKSAAYSSFDGYNVVKHENGLLYNGFAALDERNICPQGWRVPSDDDWTVLQQYMDENQYSTTAGSMLIAETEWQKQGSNVFGFNAVPAGLRYAHDGKIGHVGVHGRWWSSTIAAPEKAWNRYINSDKDYLGRGQYDLRYGYSVRCIKK